MALGLVKGARRAIAKVGVPGPIRELAPWQTDHRDAQREVSQVGVEDMSEGWAYGSCLLASRLTIIPIG
jgi:hypothetical protein